ncbi:MAG: DUF6152 family protein [Thiotrichales bacterium]
MRTPIAIGLITVALALPAAAHHGWSNYDSSNRVSLTGTVTEVSYTQPHGTIRLEADGKTWLAVLAPPSRMSARGLSSTELQTGIKATVEGYPSRNDPVEMRAERIIVNGKTIELR